MGDGLAGEIYKCAECGNIVQVLHAGSCSLVCCGQPMLLQRENTVDASREKHVPVIEKTKSGFSVKVSLVPHPYGGSALHRMDRTCCGLHILQEIP